MAGTGIEGATTARTGDTDLLDADAAPIANVSQSELFELESSHGEHVRYHLHRPGGDLRDALIVSFSSAQPGETGYSYVNSTVRPDCPTLFLRATHGLFYGTARTPVVAESIQVLLESIAKEQRVPPEHVICCGTSLGGTAALSQASRGGFGMAVVGAPGVMIGDSLLGGHGGKPAASFAASIAGAADDEARDFLNSIIPERLAQVRSELRIAVLSSREDELHEVNIPRLEEICAESDLLSLDLTLGDYTGHANVRHEFRDFAPAKIREALEGFEAVSS